MHEDIKKLIDIAKVSGELTDKQREIILRKAEALGDDRDEVEFVLETLGKKEPVKVTTNTPKIRKCPRCGAVVSEMDLYCKECGHIFEQEGDLIGKKSSAFFDIITELDAVGKETDDKYSIAREKASIINNYPVPHTNTLLIQFLILSYHNYEASNGIDDRLVSSAWLSKAKQCYSQLSAFSNPDSATKNILDQYAHLIGDSKNAILVGREEAEKNRIKLPKWVLGLIAFFVFMVAMNLWDEFAYGRLYDLGLSWLGMLLVILLVGGFVVFIIVGRKKNWF